MTKVMKFGGSSLRDGPSMTMVGEIVADDDEPRVVVVSACQGVTNEILRFMSSHHREEDIQPFISDLRGRHMDILRDVTTSMDTRKSSLDALLGHLTRLERIMYGITYLEELTPRTSDLAQSYGERMSSILVAAMLTDMGVNAVAVDADELGIVTDERFGQASADIEATRRNIAPRVQEMLERDEVPVVTGYFGVTPNGHVALFGRNGTDYSAAVIANAMGADSLEIWKDVDGFLSVDPRVVPDAVPLDCLSYEEAAELAYYGAGILHPRCVEPAKQMGIAINLRNVFSPSAKGTVIRSGCDVTKDGIKSISFLRGMSVVNAYGAGAGYELGVLARTYSGLSASGINVYSSASSQTCISVLIDSRDKPMAEPILRELKRGIIDETEIVDGVALVCVVGDGLDAIKGMEARVFRSVAEADVNIEMFSANANGVAYHFVVRDDDLETTVMAVHDEFFGP